MTGHSSAGHHTLEAARSAIWPDTRHCISDALFSDIAGQAAAADESGRLSPTTVQALRDSGYCGLPVPEELRGGGAGLLVCAAVQRRLALADPALAIAGNMHLFSVGMATHHWRLKRDSCGMLLEAIATQQRLIASAFAEPGLGGTLLHSTVAARRVAGGYLVSGVKRPCSLAACCDLVCLQMRADDGGILMAMVPAATSGIRVEQTWDALGMRGSGSDTLHLEDCFVPDELVYHRGGADPDDDLVFAGAMVWFCITTTATYLGVAEAAIDAAATALRQDRLAHLGTTRASLSGVRDLMGDLVAPTLATEASCAGLANRFDDGGHDARGLLPIAVAIKQVAVDACVNAVEQAIELVGGTAYARTSPLARLWRDVQAARFHPPSRLLARQLLGRWALGLDASFKLQEGAADRDTKVARDRATPPDIA